ncbi:hypothetical protein [Neobacillus notoginsengisoli]|uniref:hypothetical protein n=1 Tax=Neobacillus notoginsengisoli TaxID=1578198 RepID=UPI0026B71C28
MKIQNRLPTFNKEMHDDLIQDGWIPLKVPKNIVSAILFSTPLMIVAGLFSFGLMHFLSPFTLAEFGIASDSVMITIDFGVILLLVLLVVSHELLHLFFHPKFP